MFRVSGMLMVCLGKCAPMYIRFLFIQDSYSPNGNNITNPVNPKILGILILIILMVRYVA